MAVKWIGDAARELGIAPLDAVATLASRQAYPLNGLLDEEKFQLLKLTRPGRSRMEMTGAIRMPSGERPAPPPPPPPPVAAAPPAPPPPIAAVAPPPPPPPPHATALPLPPPPPAPGTGEAPQPTVHELETRTAPFLTMPEPPTDRTVIIPAPVRE